MFLINILGDCFVEEPLTSISKPIKDKYCFENNLAQKGYAEFVDYPLEDLQKLLTATSLLNILPYRELIYLLYYKILKSIISLITMKMCKNWFYF